jgi:hypothetical protein
MKQASPLYAKIRPMFDSILKTLDEAKKIVIIQAENPD